MNKEPINDAFGKPMYETDPTNARYNSLQRECYDQRKEINRLKDRIKRLEESLEARASDDELNQAWELYIKTKESKP
jgi:hypothetical protein